jgi:hypothetical protein
MSRMPPRADSQEQRTMTNKRVQKRRESKRTYQKTQSCCQHSDAREEWDVDEDGGKSEILRCGQGAISADKREELHCD